MHYTNVFGRIHPKPPLSCSYCQILSSANCLQAVHPAIYLVIIFNLPSNIQKLMVDLYSRLGEHPIALAAIYSFLADRFQATDFEGSLTVNLLKAS